MKFTVLSIPDVLLIEPCIYEDSRGFFFESFRQDIFEKKTFLKVQFVQDNHSKSTRGVLRGLHYQLPPFAQAKLVRVIHGEVLDVAVDIRRSSPNFGKYVSHILSAENRKQLWIPEGFAHGFLTLSDSAELIYKSTQFYNSNSERCILWNDKTLNIDWKRNFNFQLSIKDLNGKNFSESEYF